MTDKKNIESWTESNRHKFDDKELPVGHRELFENKLDFSLHKKVNINEGTNWYRIASVAIIFIALASSVFYFSPDYRTPIQTAGVVNFSEIESQYSEKIKEALVPIRSSKKYLSPEYRSFIKEMEKLDLENDRLKNLLLEFPDDERVLNSIIENYKNRLQLLEQLKVTISNNNLNKVGYDQSL